MTLLDSPRGTTRLPTRLRGLLQSRRTLPWERSAHLRSAGQPDLPEEDQPSLAEFCSLTDPSYQPTRHTTRLCEELEKVESGETQRLAICLPPRHSKTYHVSERFPAWWLGKHPTDQLIL